MALIEIQVPDIGDFDAVTVIELLVKPGDTVQAEQSLITVESDKASMEIPSSHAGVVQALRVQIGDQVKQGSVVLALEVADGAAAAPAAAAPAPASAPDSGAASASPATVSAPKAPETAVNQAPAAPALVAASAAAPVPAHQPTAAPTGKLPHASPSVRKFARELGVPLAEVAGTGPKGRITQADVQAFTQSVMAGRLQTQAQAAKAPAASAGTGVGLDLLP